MELGRVWIRQMKNTESVNKKSTLEYVLRRY